MSLRLNWEKNKSGTYASTTPTGKALNVKGDSIVFKNLNETTYGYGLKVKGTLYYQFIATSGTLKDTLEINSQNLIIPSGDLKIASSDKKMIFEITQKELDGNPNIN